MRARARAVAPPPVNPCLPRLPAYRILFQLLKRAPLVLGTEIAKVDGPRRSAGRSTDPAVQHALAVVGALQRGNPFRFFRLWWSAPNMGMYILDFLLHEQRSIAYHRFHWHTTPAPCPPCRAHLARHPPPPQTVHGQPPVCTRSHP